MSLERPDPMRSSIRPASTRNLNKIGANPRGHGIYKDTEGRIYHEIKGYPADQMLVSRMLKGIVNVCDVIYNKDRDLYMSNQVDMNTVAPQDPGQVYAQAKADEDILMFIFNDADHGSSNYVVSEFAYVLHDFGNVGSHFWKRGEDMNATVVAAMNLGSERDALRVRVEKLSTRFSGDEGYKFINAIVLEIKESGAETPSILRFASDSSDPVRAFQAQLLQRLDNISSAIAAYEQTIHSD